MGRSFFFKNRTSLYHRNGTWTAVFTLFDPAYGQSWLVWYCDLQEEIHSWPLNEVGLNCMGPIIHGLFSINIIPVFSFHRSLNVGKHLCSIKDLNVCVCAQSLSCVRLIVTPRTAACQVPLSIGFSRQEYWSGLPFLTPGGSSWTRDQSWVSCISCICRQVLYHWATQEAQR